jgi:hypothetical protein
MVGELGDGRSFDFAQDDMVFDGAVFWERSHFDVKNSRRYRVSLRTTQVVMQRRFWTTVVLMGSTS